MSIKRRKWSPEEKAMTVLEVLREESTLAEIATKYGISQQLISRWKTEFLANMPSVFDKKTNKIEKIKKEYKEEKEVLLRKVGQLTLDVDWLKKKQLQILEMKKKKC